MALNLLLSVHGCVCLHLIKLSALARESVSSALSLEAWMREASLAFPCGAPLGLPRGLEVLWCLL